MLTIFSCFTIQNSLIASPTNRNCRPSTAHDPLQIIKLKLQHTFWASLGGINKNNFEERLSVCNPRPLDFQKFVKLVLEPKIVQRFLS